MSDNERNTEPYDLTFALMGGLSATLRMPREMSRENYELLMQLLDLNLKGLLPALVPEQPTPEVSHG